VSGTSLWYEIYTSLLFPKYDSICLKVRAAAGVQMRLPIKLSFGK